MFGAGWVSVYVEGRWRASTIIKDVKGAKRRGSDRPDIIIHQYPTELSGRVGRKTPQKLTPLSPRSHPRHLVGKRTAQKDAIKDITSESQVNNYFPNSRSPASLTINIYFYLFLYLYITRITINNGTPHLKSLRNQKRRAALGRPAIKLLGGFN